MLSNKQEGHVQLGQLSQRGAELQVSLDTERETPHTVRLYKTSWLV